MSAPQPASDTSNMGTISSPEGLHLADLNTRDEELEADLLVGSDQFWNLATGAVRRGDSRPK